MIVVGILASLVLFVVIVWFALSKEAEKPVRRAAVIALGVIGLVMLVCLALIATGSAEPEPEPVFTGLPLAEPVRQAANPAAVYALIFGVVLVLFVGLIIFLSIKNERGKNKR